MKKVIVGTFVALALSVPTAVAVSTPADAIGVFVGPRGGVGVRLGGPRFGYGYRGGYGYRRGFVGRPVYRGRRFRRF